MPVIFTYGTLKRHGHNHGVLGNSIFIDEALTNSKEFTMYDGGFPFVSDETVDEDATGSVMGELFQVDDETTLANLDRLEGVPSLYVKREVDVTTMQGLSYKATIYVASRGSNERLKSRTPMQPKGRGKVLEWQ